MYLQNTVEIKQLALGALLHLKAFSTVAEVQYIAKAFVSS